MEMDLMVQKRNNLLNNKEEEEGIILQRDLGLEMMMALLLFKRRNMEIERNIFKLRSNLKLLRK
jgi:hypothetical protein